nr:hypothetical protein [Lentzea indica]
MRLGDDGEHVAGLADLMAHCDLGDLASGGEAGAAAAAVGEDALGDDAFSQLVVESSVQVTGGQQDARGREAVPAGVRALPEVERGGDRTAVQGAADVAFAVRADEQQRILNGRAERGGAALSEGFEVELERFLRRGEIGLLQPGRAGLCRGQVHAAGRGHVVVGVLAWAADQQDAHTGAGGAALQLGASSGSEWLSSRASRPHGPGCSRHSHAVAVAAVPASGSPAKSESIEHLICTLYTAVRVMTKDTLT